ncbi:MAG: 30S ribosome-binding factor RbfA [bacterium]|nr:30S ribosome-binding factor RbfA [bacterium]
MNLVKQKRISSNIQKTLGEIILEETHDSILKKITITACEVTNDLSFCKVYFTSLEEKTAKELEKELNDNTSSYLRGRLANKIEIRNTPKLIFKYDTSIAYGNNIEKIISNLHEEK